MKLALIFSLVTGLLFGSFFLGLKTGISKGIVYSSALEGSSAARVFEEILDYDETLESYLQRERQRDIATLKYSISLYGEYLDHWTSKVPDFTGIDSLTHGSYEYLVAFYLENHYQPLEEANEQKDPHFERAVEHVEQ